MKIFLFVTVCVSAGYLLGYRDAHRFSELRLKQAARVIHNCNMTIAKGMYE